MPGDYQLLADVGYTRLCVPEAAGGDWQGTGVTGPVLAEITRELARGDPSVALVAAMHPAVLAYWHAAPSTHSAESFTAQAEANFASALDGHWWGTMMSEPGSGGDVAKTRSTATRDGSGYRISGQKHFGSGSGQTSFMVTTARTPADEVDLFVVDMRDKSWNGDEGLTLLREWDGHGMCGTQSHAFELSNCAAERADAGKAFTAAISQVSSLSGVLFCAVVVGILDEAFAYTLERLQSKANGMRALERVELVQARNEHWQCVTLYRAARNALGSATGLREARQAKFAIAQHAENALARLSKVAGGSSYSRSSPLGQWTQDVKALGFLRPPLGPPNRPTLHRTLDLTNVGVRARGQSPGSEPWL